MDKVMIYDIKARPRLDDDEEEERLRDLERLDFESLYPSIFRESEAEHPEVAEEVRATAEFLGKKCGAVVSTEDVLTMLRRISMEREKRTPLRVAGFGMESDPLTRKIVIVDAGSGAKQGEFVATLVRNVVLGAAAGVIAICGAIQNMGLRERTLPQRDIVEDMRQASKHERKQRKRREQHWRGAQRKPPRRGNFHDGWRKK